MPPNAPEADSADFSIVIQTCRFRSVAELRQTYEWRGDAFSPWYVRGPMNAVRLYIERFCTNSLCAHYPDFHLEARDERGTLIGVLFASPSYWDGQAASLTSFDEEVRNNYVRALNPFNLLLFGFFSLFRKSNLSNALARRLHRNELREANAFVLLETLVAKEARGRRVSEHILTEARRRARELGFMALVGPFRPSGYGAFKRSRRGGDVPSFEAYCALTNADGLPIDPWLRTLTQNGMKMLRAELASVVIRRSLARFEAFRKSYKAADWYQASNGSWECGETHSWIVDGPRKTVSSVEPNMWGMISV